MKKDLSVTKRTIGINYFEKKAIIKLWAPSADAVTLILTEQQIRLPLEKKEMGFWILETDDLPKDASYLFELTKDGEISQLPDPASLYQPRGVHEASQTFDLNQYAFNDLQWTGIPLAETIIYELHVGTFSPSGNFDGIIERLDHFLELGINTIELMPLASFAGARNWGYDGVFPFAVQHDYGGPAGLQRLVDHCHQKGIAVILDVVYNHLGPEGNYLGAFGPYFTDEYKTAWGSAINFNGKDSPAVRQYFIENALMWLRDFHIDGLRLDAVHAIKDNSALPLLAELRQAVDKLGQHVGRKYHLIIESDLNDPRCLIPISQNGQGMDAHWNDDFHHSLRVSAGEPQKSYYASYNGLEDLAKSFREAYVYDGQYSPTRKMNIGAEPLSVQSKQFVVFAQNHDQIGNRLLGDRADALYGIEMQKLMAGAVFLSPYVPQLFMGEEWASPSPFQYFVDHQDPELVEAVRNGRQAEFEHEGEAPDPFAIETFQNSKLNWEALHQSPHRELFHYYQQLIRLKTTNTLLKQLERHAYRPKVDVNKQTLELELNNANENLFAVLNFSNDAHEFPIPTQMEWHLSIDSAAAEFGGPRTQIPNLNETSLTVYPQSILILTTSHVQA